MLANDPGLDPVGQIPNVPPFTKFGDRDEQLGFGDVDVDRKRSVSSSVIGGVVTRGLRSVSTRKTTLPSGPARSSTPTNAWNRRSPGFSL